MQSIPNFLYQFSSSIFLNYELIFNCNCVFKSFFRSLAHESCSWMIWFQNFKLQSRSIRQLIQTWYFQTHFISLLRSTFWSWFWLFMAHDKVLNWCALSIFLFRSTSVFRMSKLVMLFAMTLERLNTSRLDKFGWGGLF